MLKDTDNNDNFYTIKEKDGTYTAVIKFCNIATEYDANFILNAIFQELVNLTHEQKTVRTYH